MRGGGVAEPYPRAWRWVLNGTAPHTHRRMDTAAWTSPRAAPPTPPASAPTSWSSPWPTPRARRPDPLRRSTPRWAASCRRSSRTARSPARLVRCACCTAVATSRPSACCSWEWVPTPTAPHGVRPVRLLPAPPATWAQPRRPSWRATTWTRATCAPWPRASPPARGGCRDSARARATARRGVRRRSPWRATSPRRTPPGCRPPRRPSRWRANWPRPRPTT